MRFSMRKASGLLLISAVLAFTLTACGDDAADMDPAPQSGPAPAAESTPEQASYSSQGVAFDIPAEWTQAEGTDMFYTEDRKEVYGLNGVSPLGSYTPQEFLEDLMALYQGQFDTLSAPDTLSEWQSADGVDCLIADLTGQQESLLYCTKVVIAPQKNMVLTFCAQAYMDAIQDPLVVQLALNDLCGSLTFETGSQDDITGNTFLCGDGSQLCLKDDHSFRYYQSAEDHENQYYEGVYMVYRGQAAVDQIASMTEYGLTAEELEQILSANMNGYIPGGSTPADILYGTGELEDTRTRYTVCLDTFYAVILDNQRLVHSPGDVVEGGNSTLYLGYYLPELEMADLTNANAASHTQWTFQEKTA